MVLPGLWYAAAVNTPRCTSPTITGWRWSLHLVQLIAYATLLMPGFGQMVLFYMLSSRVLRSIPYGTKPRNRLDLYLPPHHWKQADEGLKPVVVFITGACDGRIMESLFRGRYVLQPDHQACGFVFGRVFDVLL